MRADLTEAQPSGVAVDDVGDRPSLTVTRAMLGELRRRRACLPRRESAQPSRPSASRATAASAALSYSTSSSGRARNSLAMIAMVVSPGWRSSVEPTAMGLTLMNGGSSGSAQTT